MNLTVIVSSVNPAFDTVNVISNVPPVFVTAFNSVKSTVTFAGVNAYPSTYSPAAFAMNAVKSVAVIACSFVYVAKSLENAKTTLFPANTKFSASVPGSVTIESSDGLTITWIV